MKPLFIKGYLQGRPVQCIMVDGGAGMNVMSLSTSEKMGYKETELMRTNTSLSAFTGEVTKTKGVMSVELMVGSKTLATVFFCRRCEWKI
jgi:thiamine pyrophosphate-dependent acetolactate synthase large subunit-like protein